MFIYVVIPHSQIFSGLKVCVKGGDLEPSEKLVQEQSGNPRGVN